MRILFHSPSPQSPTGYGGIVSAIAPRLASMGHDVAIFAYNGHWGGPQTWKGVTLFSRGVLYNGADMLAEYAAHWQAERIISVCDPWIVPARVWRAQSVPVTMWCPVQAAPLHAEYRAVLDCADDIWVYSEFGAGVLEEAGVDAIHMPLGYDPELYGALDKAECRAWFDELLGGATAGKTLIGVIAANASTVPSSRKGLDTALRIMATLKARVPGEHMMYMHTRQNTDIGGIDLAAIVRDLDIADVVLFPDAITAHQGAPAAWMAKMTAALDVLLAPSMAEGFGMPLLEAQMAGVPVVTVEWSSMPELVGDGWLVKPAAPALANFR